MVSSANHSGETKMEEEYVTTPDSVFHRPRICPSCKLEAPTTSIQCIKCGDLTRWKTEEEAKASS